MLSSVTSTVGSRTVLQVHSPLEAPAAYIARYSWIKDSSRRTLAAMATCMDDALARLVDALKVKSMWENTLFVFFAGELLDVINMCNFLIHSHVKSFVCVNISHLN